MWWNLLAWGLGSLAAVAITTIAVDFFLSEDNIGDAVQEEYPDAFKLKIKERKKNAVNVGIFDEEKDEIDEMTIESKKGISKSLRKGKVIYLN